MAYNSAGKNDGTGSARELFDVKVATDVLKYFMVTNVARPLITNESIDSGKSKSFPVVGNATASSRDESTLSELSLDSVKATERLIVIEDLVEAHSWITDLDEAMVHYNAKSAHVESIGRALSKKVDQDIIVKIIEAGRIVDQSAATTAGLKTFSDDVYTSLIQTQANFDSAMTGQEVYVMLAAAMTEFSEKDAVGQPVYILRPQAYYALLNNPANTGLTWVNDSFAQSGKVPMVLGARVIQSPNFPAITTSVGDENAVGVLFAKEAVAILELLSVNVRTDYIPTRLADLMVGKMAVGYGILNHGSAITFGFEQQS